MTEHKTFPGKTYCVTCAEGCTVTDSTGALRLECEAGKQLHLTAPSDKLFTSASAIVREVFNYAPAKAKALGLLGGGVSALPAGYLAAEFLETTGEQYIDTGLRRVDEKSFAEFLGKIHGTVFAKRAFQTRGMAFSSEARINPGSAWISYPNGDDISLSGMIYRPSNMPDNYVAPQHNVKIEYRKATVNGSIFTRSDMYEISESPTSETSPTLKLFAFANGVDYKSSWWVGSCRKFRARCKNGEVDFVPAVAMNGQPCMYDRVSKQPFYNKGTGSFIVGMTMEQARKLSKLPATGGTLTVSLPSNWQEDEGVLNARAEAEAKGWQITVKTYEAEAGAAATFGMRRIWVRKQQDEGGSYVAADGSRWSVDWCVDVWGAYPQELGYEPYRSVDAAVAYWELVPYVNPEDEILNEL